MLIHFNKYNDTKIETWITKTTNIGRQPKHGQESREVQEESIFLLFENGQTDTKRVRANEQAKRRRG